MSNRVSLNGTDVSYQEAVDHLTNQIEQLTANQRQQPATPPDQAGALNALQNNLLAAAEQARNRPSFDLVGTLDVFDGEHPERVDDFFHSLEGVGILSNWGDNEKLRIALLKLTGSAGRFIKTVEPNKVDTYESLKATLIARFSDKLPRDSYFQQLSVIQQRGGESIESFADRVRALNEKTIRVTNSAEVNSALREEGNRRALDAFLRGLHGPVGEQTRLKFPRTLEEALTTGIAIEQLLSRGSETRTALRDGRPTERKVFWAGAENCDSNISTASSRGGTSLTSTVSTESLASSDHGARRPPLDHGRTYYRSGSSESKEFEKNRNRDHSRDRHRDRSRDYNRDSSRNRGRDHSRSQSRDRYRDHSRDRSRDHGWNRHGNTGYHDYKHGMSRSPPPRNSHRGNGPSSFGHGPPGIECWWCQRKGHTQATCAAKIAYVHKKRRWQSNPPNPREQRDQRSGNGSGVAGSAAMPPQNRK